jgi:hypothetical protein
MLVRNLVSWAGADFSHAPGDVVDLPDDVAAARIEAGFAEAVPQPDAPPPAEAAPKRGRTG